MIRRILLCIFIFFISLTYSYAEANSSDFAPFLTSVSAGIEGKKAVTSVLRVKCSLKDMGTGFLHKSGNVITAAHVIEGCSNSDISLITPTGDSIKVESVISDSLLDLSLIKPKEKIIGDSLTISSAEQATIGELVATWGYPYGYSGIRPILTVGYLSGEDFVKCNDGKIQQRWVINAAFNLGNSGGPVINVRDGTIIGVVSSKLTPIPSDLEKAIRAMSETTEGVQYKKTHPDGSVEKMSEAQVIAELLNYFRGQTQLVIGHAIKLGDIQKFLKNNSIEP